MEFKKVVLVEYYSGIEQELVIVHDAQDPKSKPSAYDSLQKFVDDLRAVK